MAKVGKKGKVMLFPTGRFVQPWTSLFLKRAAATMLYLYLDDPDLVLLDQVQSIAVTCKSNDRLDGNLGSGPFNQSNAICRVVVSGWIENPVVFLPIDFHVVVHIGVFKSKLRYSTP